LSSFPSGLSKKTKSNISKAVIIAFIVGLMIIVPFVIQSPQFSSAFSPGPKPGQLTTTETNSSDSIDGASNFPDSANVVSSGGQEEPYLVQQIALASNPNQVFQIVGGQIALRPVTDENKNYFYLYVNTSKTFSTNQSDIVATAQVSGFDTNNIYWNIQTPPVPGSMNYGTIGQDLDTGATSNTLSEWQWTDLNYVFGGQLQNINYNGSYDGGGPSMCNTYSSGQERHSVYVMIVDSNNNSVYTITGGELVEQDINGVMSTTFVTFISGTQGQHSTSGDLKDCPVVPNPSITPSLRWYVRTPPTSGVSPTGNFGITGNLGVELTTSSSTNALVLFQFVDRTFQTGFIPNQGCTTCISILGSTNPVDGEQCNWPGTGDCTTTTTTTTSTSTTTITTTTTNTSTTSGSYQLQMNISPLQHDQWGYYYNVQTATFTGPNGNPIQGGWVTYYEDCGCHGGYYHGLTDATGQTTFTDTYPAPGWYTAWAVVWYQGREYCTQKQTIYVP
jgi:hypothetical protein